MEKKRKSERPLFLQAPYLKWPEIQNMAEEFRKEYVDPIDQIPVPIVNITEIKLGIQPIPIPGLMSRIDIDGFLTNDLKFICIDKEIYMDERRETRLRFTYAHEVGHLILHKKEIKLCDFRTKDMWVHFHEDFLEDELNWFENQAREFAGRLLVPKDRLIEEIKGIRGKIEEYKSIMVDEEEALTDAISRVVCKKFNVSPQVIQKRIRIEKIYEELGL
jgi:Zn-dependent peptidase ImmA (M78 family)